MTVAVAVTMPGAATAVGGPTAVLPRLLIAGTALASVVRHSTTTTAITTTTTTIAQRQLFLHRCFTTRSRRSSPVWSIPTRLSSSTSTSTSSTSSRYPAHRGPHPLSNPGPLPAFRAASTMSPPPPPATSTSTTPLSPPPLLLPRLPIFEALLEHAHRPDAATSPVVVHSLSGRSFSYAGLPADVCAARDRLWSAAAAPAAPADTHADAPDGVRENVLAGKRIAFLVENSYDYVVTLLAIFAADAIAVPLSPAFPTPELRYVVDHCDASLLVASPRFLPRAEELLAPGLQSRPSLVRLEKHMGGGSAAEHVCSQRCALQEDDELTTAHSELGAGMMLYTSGTTSRPKGVLLPLSALTAQCRSLIEAWRYTRQDRLLHVLPLHHIHGTVNGVLAPLFAGSTVEFLFPFNADAVWKRFAAPFQPHPATEDDPSPPKQPITFFTAVPTVYSRLLSTSKSLPDETLAPGREAISPAHMRLAISGSAALPTPVKQAWKDLSRGTVLLERYGMTEIGMALSCGLDPADRVDASVGWPLPSVEVRLVDVDTHEVIPADQEVDANGRERVGEIHVRGETVFREYWNNPAATASEFAAPDRGRGGRWFKTGDVAVRRTVPSAGAGALQPWARGPMYFIQGRISADIIKTGGEKVSALEVERELLSLPEVAEAAVVAVPSGKWGHKVGAVVVLDAAAAETWSPLAMRRALKGRLAAHKIPQVLKLVENISRNAMGKINKKELVKAVFADEMSADEM